MTALVLALLSAAPPPPSTAVSPTDCTAPLSVEKPCAGALVPYDMLRTFLVCGEELQAERRRRVVDAEEAAAKLAAAERREAVQRTAADECASRLAKGCTPSVEWWQGPEVVVTLLVVAVGALVAVVVLAVE